jgi:hypothetical protein
MDRASAIGEHEPWSKPWSKHEQHESMGTNTPKLGLAGCSYVANTHVLSTSASFPCPKVQQRAEAAKSSCCTTLCEGKC